MLCRLINTKWFLHAFALPAGLATLLLTGCATHPGGIAASTKPLSPGGYTVLDKVQGSDCVYYLLGVVPLTGGNELRDAVADAIGKKKNADALIEVTVDGYWEYWVLWSQVCTQVYGTAVQSKP